MIVLLLALLQTPASHDEVRFQRESDPAAICLVMTAVESKKTSAPVTSFEDRPDVKRVERGATVTWKRARVGRKSVAVICRMDDLTGEVTSIRVAGKQILAAPQPF